MRPGQDQILLNVNTATTAFFRPQLVSEFVIAMKREGHADSKIERMLRHVTVRITYKRPKRDERDMNKESIRLKTITGLGKPPAEEWFFNQDGNRTNAAKYFANDKMIIKMLNLPCINVGAVPEKKKAEEEPTAGDQNSDAAQVNNEAENRKMAKKGKDAAGGKQEKGVEAKPLMIPPEFLQIGQNQPFRYPLKKMPSTYVAGMIDVARKLPAENAHLIVNEGIKYLTRLDNPQAAPLVCIVQIGKRQD